MPRPAMFVAMVTAPMRPAWATISASRLWCLALSTSCLMPRLSSSAESRSLFSIDTVPTRIGRPVRWICLILLARDRSRVCLRLVQLKFDRVVVLLANRADSSLPSLSSTTSHVLIRSISSAMALHFSRSVR